LRRRCDGGSAGIERRSTGIERLSVWIERCSAGIERLVGELGVVFERVLRSSLVGRKGPPSTPPAEPLDSCDRACRSRISAAERWNSIFKLLPDALLEAFRAVLAFAFDTGSKFSALIRFISDINGECMDEFAARFALSRPASVAIPVAESC